LEISGARGGGDDVGSGTYIVDDGAIKPREHEVCAFFVDFFFDSCYSVEYYGSVDLQGRGKWGARVSRRKKKKRV
jgi:hypothetical protein